MKTCIRQFESITHSMAMPVASAFNQTSFPLCAQSASKPQGSSDDTLTSRMATVFQLPVINHDQHQPSHSATRGRKQGVIKTPNFLTTTFAGHTLGGETAELISNGIRSNRTCTIQISNHLSVPLTQPQHYCNDGGIYYPLPSLIDPGTREACVFSKNPSLPHGVIGILTYQIGSTNHRIAVMFSVAYNQLEFRNHFGTAVLREGDEQNLPQLFEKMYSEIEGWYNESGGNGRCHSVANDGVPMWCSSDNYEIRGTMTDRGKSIIKLHIYTSGCSTY